MTDIQKDLFSLRDEKYADFTAGLIPSIKREAVIGVRTPLLRKYAADIFKKGLSESIFSSLPHSYYEENNLHAFLIQKIKDYDSCVSELNRFLPYVDNWATCDCLCPAALKKEPEKLLEEIRIWLFSDKTYTVRFGIKCLMDFYLQEKFSDEILRLVAEVKSDEYYINMCSAWFFATALFRQYEATVPYLTDKRLTVWVHNKTIQKAVESYRITPEQKSFLKTLKIKAI